MELYDKQPVACRIAPLADRKGDTQYGIYNKADTSDHASDQTEYTWINHKRPVACTVARSKDKKKWYEEKRTRELSHRSSDKDNDNKKTISDHAT